MQYSKNFGGIEVKLEALRDYRIEPVEHRYTATESILYALGLGYGSEPSNPDHLQFVYEEKLKAVPSICNTLAHPGFWVNDPALEIDWVKILHGEQSFEILRPLPPEGHVRGTYKLLGLEDKGPKGAVMWLEKTLADITTGDTLAIVITTLMMRGDGGYGGFGAPLPPPDPLPEAEPDLIIDLRTLPQSALIYRLSGDYNPIHADPVAASKAGFPQPILHGLCTMGIATRALIEGIAEGKPDRLRSLSLRFSKPVFPGETIRTEIFRTADGARFRARSVERDLIVLDRGTATLTS
jgi:acyl dehydratase